MIALEPCPWCGSTISSTGTVIVGTLSTVTGGSIPTGWGATTAATVVLSPFNVGPSETPAEREMREFFEQLDASIAAREAKHQAARRAQHVEGRRQRAPRPRPQPVMTLPWPVAMRAFRGA